MNEFIIGETMVLDVDWKSSVNFIIVADGLEVGKIRVEVMMDRCEIEYIEIYEEYRRRGYAEKVVNQLRENYTIMGSCLPKKDSIAFWESVGAMFDEYVTIEECLFHGSCIPFTL